jgi:hypothetical protein
MCSYQGSTQEIQIPLSMFLLCPVVVRTFLVLVSNLENFHSIRMAKSMSEGPLNLRGQSNALPTTSICPIYCAPLFLLDYASTSCPHPERFLKIRYVSVL